MHVIVSNDNFSKHVSESNIVLCVHLKYSIVSLLRYVLPCYNVSNNIFYVNRTNTTIRVNRAAQQVGIIIFLSLMPKSTGVTSTHDNNIIVKHYVLDAYVEKCTKKKKSL